MVSVEQSKNKIFLYVLGSNGDQFLRRIVVISVGHANFFGISICIWTRERRKLHLAQTEQSRLSIENGIHLCVCFRRSYSAQCGLQLCHRSDHRLVSVCGGDWAIVCPYPPRSPAKFAISHEFISYFIRVSQFSHLVFSFRPINVSRWLVTVFPNSEYLIASVWTKYFQIKLQLQSTLSSITNSWAVYCLVFGVTVRGVTSLCATNEENRKRHTIWSVRADATNFTFAFVFSTSFRINYDLCNQQCTRGHVCGSHDLMFQVECIFAKL